MLPENVFILTVSKVFFVGDRIARERERERERAVGLNFDMFDSAADY